jgi:hypothetical protein
MSLGTVFVSHKHKDKEIAKVVGDFIRAESGNRVDIFLSSDPKFKGTRDGESLASELGRAIEKAGVMILIYTGKSAGVDWEYCIWECASAQNKGIRVLVWQCVDEAPAPFLGLVRTLATEESNIFKFTKEFLTSPDFFRDQTEPVTGYSPDDPKVKERADVLHNKLKAAIEKHLGKEPRPWSAWPSLRLRLEGAAVGGIGGDDTGTRVPAVRAALLEQGTITDSSGADRIFGVGIDDGQTFGPLVESWQESYPDHDVEWLESICTQIEAFSRKRFPVLREARLPEAKADTSVIPIVTNMLSHPTTGDKEFDVGFYNIQARSPAIEEIMIDKEKVYCRKIAATDGSELSLRQVYKDMKSRSINRLPILDESWHVLYMVHRSVMSEFLLDSDLDAPTLDDLLQDPKAKEAFRNSVVFVAPSATVEEAREALAAVDGARDVFITAGGSRDEPILGMVANTDLERPT